MNKILDENYLDLIIDNTLLGEQVQESDITRLNNMYSILHVLREDPTPCELGQLYEYYSFPSLYTPMAQAGIDDAGVSSVQNNPYLALYGQGILVGVIDTGIDYRHPAFLDKDGSTRIVSIWDQSIQDGTPPAGFQYGTEYGRDMINRALRAENPLDIVPTADTNGHGTAIASIIAGSLNEDNGGQRHRYTGGTGSGKTEKAKKESAPNIFCAGGCGVLPGNRYYAGIEISGGGIPKSQAPCCHLFRTRKQSGEP